MRVLSTVFADPGHVTADVSYVALIRIKRRRQQSNDPGTAIDKLLLDIPQYLI
jgi:hypothetical protein